MSDTALIVIDAQESFRQRKNWHETDTARYLRNQQALIDGARAAGMPVVRVLHHEPQGIFSLAAGFVKPLDELTLDPDVESFKTRHSALVGTGLDVWLTKRGIRRIIVSGIRTEQCCEKATLTFDVPYGDKVVTVQEITERTEAALAGRFATVVTVAEPLSRGPPCRMTQAPRRIPVLVVLPGSAGLFQHRVHIQHLCRAPQCSRSTAPAPNVKCRFDPPVVLWPKCSSPSYEKPRNQMDLK